MKRREFIVLLGGAAVVWPLAVRAQNANRRPQVGVLWHAANAEEEGPYFKALVEGFAARGYVDGHTITLHHRFPNETPELFRRMAADLVALKIDVLVSVGNVASPYAKNATETIPVVFILVADPIGSKLVGSLARPSGNVTGLTNFVSDVVGRRLQLLKELIPELSRIGQLVNPNAAAARLNIELTREAAARLGFAVQLFEARSVEELERAFDTMAAAGMQAVTVNPEGLAFQARELIAKLALARQLALCAYSRETFEPGAFMSYGTDHLAICRRAAVYVDRILKGTKPSDLPVEGPTKFEFLINLKTARALGLDLPPTLLARADEVIE
jgi:putative tryptophan/tyrosine transport system substrate-binding protein